MPVTVDIEALVSTFLRGHAVIGPEVNARVYTDLPHNRLYPLVLITRTGGDIRPGFALSEVQVRIEAYHEGHLAAHDLGALVASTLETELPGAHDLGCVSEFRTGTFRYDPDPEAADGQGHARPRYVIEATVHCHP
jgi:hypothetical protein